MPTISSSVRPLLARRRTLQLDLNEYVHSNLHPVIVGKGTHSKGGVQKVGPAIQALMEKSVLSPIPVHRLAND